MCTWLLEGSFMLTFKSGRMIPKIIMLLFWENSNREFLKSIETNFAMACAAGKIEPFKKTNGRSKSEWAA